jgi:adenosylcobyric acid synthase
MKADLLPRVLDSFHRLAQGRDLILVEGAGSPAEVNLRAGDIANMGFATAARVPVFLVGDIDRGGVIAQLVGTHSVLPEDDRALIRAFVINKFRGDPTLFDDGLRIVTDRTGWDSLGVVPWFPDAWRLPAEDIMDIRSRPGGPLRIAVPRLNRIANFDDLDPLSADPQVSVEIIPEGRPLPGDSDLILIPGSKSTIADLAHFRAQGWDIDLYGHVRRGGRVMGICGGYQMLGQRIEDPDGIEGPASSVPGLGLLDVITVMGLEKRLALTTATYIPTGDTVSGYEIHLGQTEGPDRARPWLRVEDRGEGAASPDGRIRGAYLHGIFAADAFRAAFLRELGAPAPTGNYAAGVETTLDALAAHLESHLDVDRVLELSGPVHP